MNQRMKHYEYKRPSTIRDEYNDLIKTLTTQTPDIYGFLSIRAESEYQANSFQIDNWQYIMMTKDNRPVKGDIIDGKEVLFKVPHRRYNILLMQEIS